MGRTEMLDRIQQHYDTFWQGDLDQLQQQMAPDFVDDARPDQPAGWRPVRDFAAQARAAFPDMTVTVEEAVVEGRSAAVLCTWRGTHTGSAPGMPATGRPVTFQSVVIWRFDAQDRIVRRTSRNEQAALMAQLMQPV